MPRLRLMPQVTRTHPPDWITHLTHLDDDMAHACTIARILLRHPEYADTYLSEYLQRLISMTAEIKALCDAVEPNRGIVS